jgi:hypothetical protein
MSGFTMDASEKDRLYNFDVEKAQKILEDQGFEPDDSVHYRSELEKIITKLERDRLYRIGKDPYVQKMDSYGYGIDDKQANRIVGSLNRLQEKYGTDEIRKLMYDVNEDESSWNKGESSPLDIATLGPWMKFRINMSPRPGLERQEAEKLQMLHRNKDLNRESEPQINKYRKAKGAGSDWA